MSEPNPSNLPALREILVGESAYRALEQQAAAAADLRSRVASLTKRLAYAHREIDAANHFLGCLLTALDDLERAEAAVQVAGRVDAIAEGVALVRRALESSLAEADVREVVVAVGDGFDPERHEAAKGGLGSAAAQGTVRAVLRRGWERRGEMVRPPLVEVDWEAR